MPDEFTSELFIVQSGDGYFMQFTNNCAAMSTDRVQAKRLSRTEALSVKDRIERNGFSADIIPVHVTYRFIDLPAK